MSELLQDYRWRGARAMVLLHEDALREAVDTWRRARAAEIRLPVTDDPDYESLEHLLLHLFRSARGYMIWMCDKLGLPDPAIDPPPPVDRVAVEAEPYLEHLLARWRLPLAGVDEARMAKPVYEVDWGTEFSAGAMLEHALVHPLRHRFQLEELLEAQS